MSVLNEFKRAIAIHQQKDDEAFEEQINLPLEERVAKGVTMNNLRVEFIFFDEAPNRYCPHLNYPNKFIRAAKVYCQNNISKFREGGQVILSNGNYIFKMEIIKDTVNEFIIAPNDFDVKTCYIDSEDYNPNHWEINIAKTDLTLQLMSAIAGNLENDSIRLSRIEKILSGSIDNSQISNIEYKELNIPQNEAVSKAINSKYFHIIQGPPGTGKTETIAHIAKILINEGKKVFITAPTHTAINNCLNAISKQVKDKTKVVKIGEKYQASEILKNEFITRKTRLPIDAYYDNYDLSQDGIIIGGTPFCFCYPASKRLNHWEFDVALIDEAAQLSIPMAIAVMSKSDKFIYVGDHKQLDPVIPFGTGVSMFSESIFSRFVKIYPNSKTLLNISYRLNEQLIRIPNQLFYDNKLTSDFSTLANRSNIRSNSHSDIFNNKDAHILYLHKVFDSQGRSPHEAEIVAGLVKDMISNGVDLKEIGILTPYRAQVREIKKAINSKVGTLDFEEGQSLFIDTVDRMQGQERDFIIYSMSNSHPLESKRRLDFFYSPNRLNVAITRARQKCIVIANYKVFDIIDEELIDLPEYEMLKSSLDIFKEYYKLSTQIRADEKEINW